MGSTRQPRTSVTFPNVAFLQAAGKGAQEEESGVPVRARAPVWHSAVASLLSAAASMHLEKAG